MFSILLIVFYWTFLLSVKPGEAQNAFIDKDVLMVENNNFGCGIWGFGAILSFVFLAFWVTGNNAVPNAALTISPKSTSTTTLESQIVVTAVSEPPETYFEVENNRISFAYQPDPGIPCNYHISGYVLDMIGKPFTNYVVNIMTVPLKGVITEGPSHHFPNDGSHVEDDPSEYAVALANWQISYEIWLTDKVGGMVLSPHIVVPGRDCDLNRAIVNFVQVRSLP